MKVQPIKNDAIVAEILETLETRKDRYSKRLLVLFALGIFTGLRISDIVRLRVENVRGDYIRLREEKTGKQQNILIGKDLRIILDNYIDGKKDDDYLLASRVHRKDGTQKPISTRQALYDMKKIAAIGGIAAPFGCHSMRKTYGYQMYKENKMPIEALRQQFNHASEAVTRRYIGVDEDERNKYVNTLHYNNYRPMRTKHKPGHRRDSKPLYTCWQDRTENGKKYGETLRAKAEGKKNKD